jgi:DNA-binding NtrC family response regulator
MKQSLLIADGDAASRDLYGTLLTAQGYEAETASDGLDCLSKLRRTMPAALVLDLELRWGGGEGVLAWLREESLTHQISVILTATAEYPRDFTKYIKPPVVACLRKPFAAAALLETVRFGVPEKTERTEPSSRTGADDEKNAFQTTASFPTTSQEDRRLAERVASALLATGYAALRRVEVRVNRRVVHLVGRVHSYHLKQMAQETVLAVTGTQQIHNDLDVL